MNDTSRWGFPIVVSDLVGPDTGFLVDKNSIELKWLTEVVPRLIDEQHRFNVQVEVVGKEKVVETNPLHWHRPHHLHDWFRLAGSVVGYYYRKVTGKLRYYESINAVKLVGISS